MDNPPNSERRGPQFYLHVEFGLSWNSKQAPKNHEVTYRSRGMRERTPAFPRQVPATNTNYLAAIRDFEARQTAARESRALQPHAISDPHHGAYHQMQEYYQSEIQQQEGQPPAIQLQDLGRQSRASSRSSHERGRSAPPPIGDNPWDVTVPQPAVVIESSRSTLEPSAPNQWKSLPAEPSQFRLGEDGMPWSSLSWPMGYDPATDTEDEPAGPSSRPSARLTNRSASVNDVHERTAFAYAAPPLTVSAASPNTTTASRPLRNDDPTRVRDLETLSAALVTVDNGFENQWWNQGQREVVREVVVTEPSSPARPENRVSRRSLGWAVAQAPQEPGPEPETLLATPSIRSFAELSLVSPISDLSPPPSYHHLHRSLSTRSDELWIPEHHPR